MQKMSTKRRAFYLVLSLPIICNLILPPFTYSSTTDHLRAPSARDGGKNKGVVAQLATALGRTPKTAADGGARALPEVATSIGELLHRTQGFLEVSPTKVHVLDPALYRSNLLPYLVHEASVSRVPEVREGAQWILRVAALDLGILEASIRPIFDRHNKEGVLKGRTVAAKNLRTGPAFDAAVVVFEEMIARKAGLVVFELAKSEQSYTDQTPAEYAAIILAAASATGYTGPVFIQGDHYQVPLKDFLADPEKAMASWEKLVSRSLAGGELNIDIDVSTLIVESAISTVTNLERTVVDRYIAERRTKDSAFDQFIAGLEEGLASSDEKTKKQAKATMELLRHKLFDDLSVVALSGELPAGIEEFLIHPETLKQDLQGYIDGLEAGKAEDPFDSIERFDLPTKGYRDSLSHYGLRGSELLEFVKAYELMHRETSAQTLRGLRFIDAEAKRLGLKQKPSTGAEERHIDDPKHKENPSTVLGSISLMRRVRARAEEEGLDPPVKLALQTGASHGLGGENVDKGIFSRHHKASSAIGVDNFVQHGTSTLKDHEFPELPASGTTEAHLATSFQMETLYTIAERIPEYRDLMGRLLEGMVYPDRAQGDILTRLQEAGMYNVEKTINDFRSKWEAFFGTEPYDPANPEHTRKMLEIAGQPGSKARGTFKDLVKFAVSPMKREIEALRRTHPEVQREIDSKMRKQVVKFLRDFNLEGTRELVAVWLPLTADDVVIPAAPFAAAGATEAPGGPTEVDTSGEDGGNKRLDAAEIRDRIQREFGITPTFSIKPGLIPNLISGRIPEQPADLFTAENVFPLLVTQLIVVDAQREGWIGRAVREGVSAQQIRNAEGEFAATRQVENRTTAWYGKVKALEKRVADMKAKRKEIKTAGDLRAQEIQSRVAQALGIRLTLENFETKGEVKGGHEAGTVVGDPNGIPVSAVTDVWELTDAVVDGLPGSSSVDIHGPAASYFGRFPDEARALMLATHINWGMASAVLADAGLPTFLDTDSLEKYLDPKLPVDELVRRVAKLNGTDPGDANVTILTGDESDIAALEVLRIEHPSLQIDRVGGGTVQPAVAGIIGVRDNRVRLFIRRSGMTEAVQKILFAGPITNDGAISLFSVVSPEVKKGNDHWNDWPEKLAAEMAKRPDWEAIQKGKIFSSRELANQAVAAAYTFMTDGRTDKGLPFNVPGVKADKETGTYEVNSLLVASNPKEPGRGYVVPISAQYKVTEPKPIIAEEGIATSDGGAKAAAARDGGKESWVGRGEVVTLERNMRLSGVIETLFFGFTPTDIVVYQIPGEDTWRRAEAGDYFSLPAGSRVKFVRRTPDFARDGGKRSPETSVQRILERLRGGEIDVAGAVSELQTIPSPPVRILFLELLGSRQNELYKRVIVATLGKTDDPRIVDALLVGLEDDFWSIRYLSAEVLENSRDRRAVPALLAAVEKEEDPEVLTSLARALGNSADSRSIPALLEALERIERSYGKDVPRIKGVKTAVSEAVNKIRGRYKGGTSSVPDGGARAHAADTGTQVIHATPAVGIQEMLDRAIPAFGRPLSPAPLQSAKTGTIVVYEEALNNLTIARMVQLVAAQLRPSNPNIQFALVSTSGKSGERIVADIFDASKGLIDLSDVFKGVLTKDRVDVSDPRAVAEELEFQGLQPVRELIAPRGIVEAWKARVRLYAWLVSRNPSEGETGIANGADAVLGMVEIFGLDDATKARLVQAGGREFTATLQSVGEDIAAFDREYRANRGV